MISTMWIEIERLKVVEVIAEHMREKMLQNRGALPTTFTLDMTERLYFLACASPEFLENNRDRILEDLEGLE